MLGIVAAFAQSSAETQYNVSGFFIGQPPSRMYVQRWSAAGREGARNTPLIVIHGGAHTGTAFTSTPDGEPGWAQQFATLGWDIYVVDRPGVGRSGVFPANINLGVDVVIDALSLLLERTGSAVLIGHSIGGALAIKVSERVPNFVRAPVPRAPASVEVSNPAVPPVPVDQPNIVPKEVALKRFATAFIFPKTTSTNYYALLVAMSPTIRNAAVGLTNEFKLDRSKVGIWSKTPVLFLVAEEDLTVPRSLSDETAKVMNVKSTALGADWGQPGHGHIFIIEKDQAEITKRLDQWLRSTSAGK